MTLADGRVFVTYFQFFLSQQILIWTNSVGTVVREDTLMLSGAPTISFAYAEGSQVVLVDVMPSQAGRLPKTARNCRRSHFTRRRLMPMSNITRRPFIMILASC